MSHQFGRKKQVCSPISSFVFQTLLKPPLSSSRLYGIRCENKYYQLEEMEDKDNSTTELFLTAEGNVEFGETDGPLWSDAEGRWHVEPGTDDFTMTIIRRFNTGASNTDMGEFSYEIGRSYVGVMTKVGDSVGITGVMHSLPDEFGSAEQEVGYFNMIDGTYGLLSNSLLRHVVFHWFCMEPGNLSSIVLVIYIRNRYPRGSETRCPHGCTE